MGGSPSREVTILPGLVDASTLVVEMFSVWRYVFCLLRDLERPSDEKFM